jgi:predicted nucleotide-binding protein
LVAFFAFFLTEVAGDASVKPKRIRDCFEAALLVPLGNISDVMGKSRFFVSTKSGQQLQRAVRNRIAAVMGAADDATPKAAVAVPRNGNAQPDSGTAPAPVAAPVPGLSKNVMVVYGRDQQLSDSMFGFLRALKLNPIEWSEAVRATGKGSPYVGEILDAAFTMAQAVVVLLTPDEHVQLRRDLCSSEDEFLREEGFQPRANVLIEAGMALARAEARTVIVEVGDVRQASDVHGRHVVKLNDSAEKRNELAQRLKTAGCEPDTSNPHWYRVGTFKVGMKRKRGIK